MPFADIIVDISIEKLNRPFTYEVPDSLLDIIKIGDQVMIPFGRGNSLKKGFVIGLKAESGVEEGIAIKAIDSILPDCGIYGELIRLSEFMAEQFGGTLNQALRTCLPLKKPGKIKEKEYIYRKADDDTLSFEIAQADRKHAVARLRLLEALKEDSVIPRDILVKKLHVSGDAIRKLAEKGIIVIDKKREYRDVLPNGINRNSDIVLNASQKQIVDSVIADYRSGANNVSLIKGVTGSGKTEVYMEIMDAVIRDGKKVILLIPEIALTYQTLIRYYRRFGDRIAVLHSKLSDGERFDQISRVENGEVDIMIGPRSALFTPFKDIGLIVIDEEHENAYKSEQIPRYHAVAVAKERIRMSGGMLILGSATPSMDSFYKAKKGEYKLYELNERFYKNPLPEVHIADMRDELRKGNISIFSSKLDELIKDRLNKHEQIMLFLNRRGLTGFVSCRSCGYVVKCPNCDVSLTLHSNKKMVCHYCGYETSEVKTCPACGSKYIAGFKVGTEKIEELIHKNYPEARVLRMDADTTKGKTGHEDIVAAFINKEADILIGTQMIVKGHDFPDVTLVGILAADMSLFANDYHANENTFELLTQAAGRAGRGSVPGEVVIQTYNPDNFAIKSAASHDYYAFYNEEIMYRSLMKYPPAGNLLTIMITSESEEKIERLSMDLASVIKSAGDKSVTVLGPVDATIKRINNVYRKVIYIKAKEYETLVIWKNRIEEYRRKTEYRDGSVGFDFNPSGSF